jgi:hypothetical protein
MPLPTRLHKTLIYPGKSQGERRGQERKGGAADARLQRSRVERSGEERGEEKRRGENALLTFEWL